MYCYLILVIRCFVTRCLQKGLELPGAVYLVHLHGLERKFIKIQRVLNSYAYLKENKTLCNAYSTWIDSGQYVSVIKVTLLSFQNNVMINNNSANNKILVRLLPDAIPILWFSQTHILFLNKEIGFLSNMEWLYSVGRDQIQ